MIVMLRAANAARAAASQPSPAQSEEHYEVVRRRAIGGPHRLVERVAHRAIDFDAAVVQETSLPPLSWPPVECARAVVELVERRPAAWPGRRGRRRGTAAASCAMIMWCSLSGGDARRGRARRTRGAEGAQHRCASSGAEFEMRLSRRASDTRPAPRAAAGAATVARKARSSAALADVDGRCAATRRSDHDERGRAVVPVCAERHCMVAPMLALPLRASCWNGSTSYRPYLPGVPRALPRANRNRVAELAIKHLPRPDGYTTPPRCAQQPRRPLTAPRTQVGSRARG